MRWIRSKLVVCVSLFLVSLCFGSFIVNQKNNVSAVSVTCDLTSYLPFNSSVITISDYCDISSLDSNKDWSWTFDFDVLDSYGNTFYLKTYKSSTYGGLGEFFIFSDARFVSSSCSSYPVSFCSLNNPYSIIINDYSTKTNNLHFIKLEVSSSSRWSYFSSFSITISDSDGSPSGSISITENGEYDVSSYATAVVEVPDTETIVYGDYHDDLVKIYNAIIICAGVALVIYFFYCIYRMIIKTLGGY